MAKRHEHGRQAEDLVAAYLVALGCEVLDRNVRVGSLELDIIAREGRTLAIVEVRTRGATAWESAFGSISGLKQRRVRDAAAVLWATRFSKWPMLDGVRFDVAAVSLEARAEEQIDYIKAAFI